MTAASEACKRYRKKHPEKIRMQLLLNNARIRANKAGVPFSIKAEDIVIPLVCPVFGVALALPDGSPGPGHCSPSLDRVVPELGYVPGNIRVISYRANRIRNDATVEELAAVLTYARSLHGSQ